MGAAVLDWSRAQAALMRPDQGTRALAAVFRDLIETQDGATYVAGRVWGMNLLNDKADCSRAKVMIMGRSTPARCRG